MNQQQLEQLIKSKNYEILITTQANNYDIKLINKFTKNTLVAYNQESIVEALTFLYNNYLK